MDVRYSSDNIVSHSGLVCSAIPVNNLQNVLAVVGKSQYVLIDEGQFFMDLAQGCSVLTREGKTVLVAALAATADQKPWQAVSEVIAIADSIIHKCAARCSVCGIPDAPHTRTKVPMRAGETIRIGGADTYEPVCKDCINAQ